jgi:hypothetical protein
VEKTKANGRTHKVGDEDCRSDHSNYRGNDLLVPDEEPTARMPMMSNRMAVSFGSWTDLRSRFRTIRHIHSDPPFRLQSTIRITSRVTAPSAELQVRTEG